MQRSPGANWEYYRPGVEYFSVQTFDVGTVVIETTFQVYGPNNALKKTFKIDARVASFSPSPGFPSHLLDTAKLNLTPVPGVVVNADSSIIQNLNIGVNGTIRRITIPGGAEEQSTGTFDVTFSWVFSGSDPRFDYFSIRAFMPKYYYTVSDTPRRLATEPYPIIADGGSGYLDEPWLRCDHAVATEDATPENGCVFYDAAPIFEISKSGNAAEEAAHIEYAQTTRDPIYKKKYSPGVFFAAAGTRAIANESAAGEQSIGLTRGEPSDRALNNNNACKYTTSLIRNRPYSGSSQCGAPTPSNCQCDEYPFAASRDGAAYNPDGTSVRYIVGGENASGGGQLIGFFKRDRVFRGEKFWVRVTP